MKAVLIVFLLLTGCTATPDAKAPPLRPSYRMTPPRAQPDMCPPLPTLREGATVFEERLLNETTRLLYAQCAESKR